MTNTPLEAILSVLGGAGPQRAITVAHAENLPRGDCERKLRNAGLALVTPPLAVWRCEWPGVTFGCSEAGQVRTDTISTAAGSICATRRTQVARSIACDLPYDASVMRRELEVEPWIKVVADIAPAIDWIDAEVHLPDHEVYEHARYDYGADALLVVRGPVSATGAAFKLCGSRVGIWRELWQEAASSMSALLSALAQREHRKLAVLAGCHADLVLLGGDDTPPVGADQTLRRYDLPLLQTAAQQCAREGLLFGLEVAALPSELVSELTHGAMPSVLVVSWPWASGLPDGLPLWVKLPRETLAQGSMQAQQLAGELLRCTAGRRLVVDLDDAGLARCTSPADREQLVTSAAAVLAAVGGFCAQDE
jgi:hypothetical protein